MNSNPHLDALRQHESHCIAVGYADIASGMVLAASAESPLSQDKWDDLCASAADVLIGQSATTARTVMGAASRVSYAVLFPGDTFAIAVASPKEPDCALCALCDPRVDIAAFVDVAKSTLIQVASYD